MRPVTAPLPGPSPSGRGHPPADATPFVRPSSRASGDTATTGTEPTDRPLAPELPS